MHRRSRIHAFAVAVALLVSVALITTPSLAGDPGTWVDKADVTNQRHEAAYVQIGGKLHLIGGESPQHLIYDPVADDWSNNGRVPWDPTAGDPEVNIDHVQGVAVGGKIYFIGGILSWPNVHSSAVWIYDPVEDTWSEGTPMPRGRGAGGVAVYRGNIYYAGGLADGVPVNWFDRYIPSEDRWEEMPNMPSTREHFQAAVVQGRFYVVGGRRLGFDNLVRRTVRFTFATGVWKRRGLAPIPTSRAGFAVGKFGPKIVVFGGEGGGEAKAAVEMYNTRTDRWRTLASMLIPRHGLQGAKWQGGVFLATGADDQGAHPTAAHDAFCLVATAGACEA